MGLTVQIDGGGKDFEPVQEMLQGGVIADIVDKGIVPVTYAGKTTNKHKMYIVWVLSEEDADGKNKRAFQSFTVSLNEKARLRKFLESLGYKDKDFSAGPFDLDQLIGTKRYLVLAYEDPKEKGGKPFLSITATMKLSKGQTAPDIPADFVRKQDQPAK